MKHEATTLTGVLVSVVLLAGVASAQDEQPPVGLLARKAPSDSGGPTRELTPPKTAPVPAPLPSEEPPAVDAPSDDDLVFPRSAQPDHPWWDPSGGEEGPAEEPWELPEFVEGVEFSVGGEFEYDRDRSGENAYFVTPVELSIELPQGFALFVGGEGHGYQRITSPGETKTHSGTTPDMWVGMSYAITHGGGWAPEVELSISLELVVSKREWNGRHWREERGVYPEAEATFGWELPLHLSLEAGVGVDYVKDEHEQRFVRTTVEASLSRSLDPLAHWVHVLVGVSLAAPDLNRSQVSAKAEVELEFELSEHLAIHLVLERGIVHKVDAEWGGGVGLTVSF